MNGLTNNSGQICFASTRVYVQESIYDKFIEAYVAKIADKKNVIGDPEKEGTELGPVVDQHQYDRIMNIIDTAKKDGQGSLLLGGNKMGSKVRRPLFPNDYQDSKLMDQFNRGTTSSQRFLLTRNLMLRSIKTRYLDLWWLSIRSKPRRKLCRDPMTADMV